MASTPKIFLSFAREDTPWVNQFTNTAWFQVGDTIKIENYMAGDNLEFGGLGDWVDQQVNEAAVVIAFVSEYYQQKRWTKEELNKTLNEFRRRRLIFIPIMMDPYAKNWWAELRQQGSLSALPQDYQYSDFIDDNGNRSKIADNDSVQMKIVKLSVAIKKALLPPEREIPPPPPPGRPVVVLLGHPTNALAKDIAAEAKNLAAAVEGAGMVLQYWTDGWLRSASSRGELRSGDRVIFVQPLAGGEAAEQVSDISRTAQRLAIAGIPDAKTVLWLPAGQSDPIFEAAAAGSANELLDFTQFDQGPALRTDVAAQLAVRLRSLLNMEDASDDPVLQIETVGSPIGTTPDSEARRLSKVLIQSFGEIVNGVIATESTSPWTFWDKQFKDQIAILPGSRAIVAVHDLDVTPSPDRIANRKRIELKFQQMHEYVRENATKLEIFWAALLYKNANALPFGRYPYDQGRFKDWRLLRFERSQIDGLQAQPVKPDPASLGVFRAELSDWAHKQ
jgi:hypothetical protein